MLGKLTWDAIPWDQPIPLIAGAAVLVIVLAIIAWIIIKGHLPYLWHEWITSVDHKRIGVMYTLLGLVMLLRGFIDAIMMRSQQAIAYNGPGYLPPEHYDQIFSAHGTIMIFFVAMALDVRPDEFRRAVAAWRARRRVPVLELHQPLADRHGRVAGQHLARRRRILTRRLAAVPAAGGTRSILPA